MKPCAGVQVMAVVATLAAVGFHQVSPHVVGNENYNNSQPLPHVANASIFSDGNITGPFLIAEDTGIETITGQWTFHLFFGLLHRYFFKNQQCLCSYSAHSDLISKFLV